MYLYLYNKYILMIPGQVGSFSLSQPGNPRAFFVCMFYKVYKYGLWIICVCVSEREREREIEKRGRNFIFR